MQHQNEEEKMRACWSQHRYVAGGYAARVINHFKIPVPMGRYWYDDHTTGVQLSLISSLQCSLHSHLFFFSHPPDDSLALVPPALAALPSRHQQPLVSTQPLTLCSLPSPHFLPPMHPSDDTLAHPLTSLVATWHLPFASASHPSRYSLALIIGPFRA